MYLPDIFNPKDEDQLVEFIRAHNFADLVTIHNGELCSNKVPFLFDARKNRLYGHISRANPQVEDLVKSEEVLVIFSGPNAYVSPQWYVSEGMVPTWNYQTVQVRGISRLVDESELLEILERLSYFHESLLPKQWSIKQLDSVRLKTLLNLIVGFELEITKLTMKNKMSQNRSVHDRINIIQELNQQANSNANEVAILMQNTLNI